MLPFHISHLPVSRHNFLRWTITDLKAYLFFTLIIVRLHFSSLECIYTEQTRKRISFDLSPLKMNSILKFPHTPPPSLSVNAPQKRTLCFEIRRPFKRIFRIYYMHKIASIKLPKSVFTSFHVLHKFLYCMWIAFVLILSNTIFSEWIYCHFWPCCCAPVCWLVCSVLVFHTLWVYSSVFHLSPRVAVRWRRRRRRVDQRPASRRGPGHPVPGAAAQPRARTRQELDAPTGDTASQGWTARLQGWRSVVTNCKSKVVPNEVQ